MVLGGVAAVSGGTGAYFGGRSRQELGQSNAARYQDDALARLHEAQRSATIANVLFAVGGTAATSAVLAYLFASD